MCSRKDFLSYILTSILHLILPNHIAYSSSNCQPQFDSTIFRCSRLLTSIPTTSIHPETLELDLANNLIEILHEDSFSRLKLVRKLTLRGNRIHKITERAFMPLADSLIYLDLSMNELESSRAAPFPAKAFAPLTRLVYLDLSNNSLDYLPSGFLINLGASLVELLLNNVSNRLELQTGAFQGLGKLRRLGLEHNTMKDLNEGSFQGLRPGIFSRLEFNGLTWICDCQLIWLRRWMERVPRQALAGDRFPGGRCIAPPSFSNLSLMSLTMGAFQCVPELWSFSPRTSQSHITVYTGRNVTLSCSFTSRPKMKVQWFQNDALIQAHRKGIRIDTGLGTNFTTSMHIVNLQAQRDSGKYRCQAGNSKGIAAKTFNLRVEPEPVYTSRHTVSTANSSSSQFSSYILAIGIIILANTAFMVLAAITYNCVKYRGCKWDNEVPGLDPDPTTSHHLYQGCPFNDKSSSSDPSSLSSNLLRPSEFDEQMQFNQPLFPLSDFTAPTRRQHPSMRPFISNGSVINRRSQEPLRQLDMTDYSHKRRVVNCGSELMHQCPASMQRNTSYMDTAATSVLRQDSPDETQWDPCCPLHGTDTNLSHAETCQLHGLKGRLNCPIHGNLASVPDLTSVDLKLSYRTSDLVDILNMDPLRINTLPR